jgi:extracellular factor (EF) 3-hydroxypalmitic acid methyl ester biosynthesis protein
MSHLSTNTELRSSGSNNSSQPITRRFDEHHSSPADTHMKFVTEVTHQLQAHSKTSNGNPTGVQETVHRLFGECKRLRDHLPEVEWKKCIETIRGSELMGLVHQDPFTGRAFNKPRGYAGDAVMMDYIYGSEEAWTAPATSPLGHGIFNYTTNAAASSGVRARREHIAEKLDEIAREKVSPDVLAIACGHLREASMSSAVRRSRFGKFIALDADEKSLQEVDRNFGRFGIQIEKTDVRKLITGRMDLGQFDLVYSTGLYDYLNQKTAQKLTLHLFNMLKPGGRLVIANFLPNINDIGYMEACMDWFLVYRNRMDMMGMTELIDLHSIRDIRIHSEDNQNIIFLEMVRS